MSNGKQSKPEDQKPGRIIDAEIEPVSPEDAAKPGRPDDPPRVDLRDSSGQADRKTADPGPAAAKTAAQLSAVSLRMQAFVAVKGLSFVLSPHDQSVSSGICCISITLQPRSGPVDGLCCSFVTARVTSTVGSIRFQNQSADGRT